MRELIINGQIADIDEKTAINLQFKSFLFEGVASIQGNRSWTVQLPLTARNLAIVESAHMADYAGDFPYKKYTVNYYSAGFKIIENGWAVLTGINKTINFVFTFSEVFQKIKELSQKKLTDFYETTNDRVPWNSGMDLTNNTSGIRWANWYSYTNEDRSLTPPEPSLPYSTLHPVVTLKWMIERIASDPLVGLDLTELANIEKMDKLGFPLRRTTGERTFSYGGIVGIDGWRQITIEGNTWVDLSAGIFSGDTFTYHEGGTNELNWYELNPDVVKHEGVWLDITGTFFVVETELGEPFTLSVFKNGLDVGSVIIDQSNVNFTRVVFNQSETTINYGDKITFAVTLGDLTQYTALDSHFEISIRKSTGQTSYTGDFYIIPNLPDMTCADFLYQCAQLAGVFPVSTNGNKILFRSAATLYDNIENALDWSDKLVKTTPRAGQIEDVAFKFGSYTKSNTLKYATDDTNPLDTRGYLSVDNENLDEDSTLVDLKFAAGKRFSDTDFVVDYPLYDVSEANNVITRKAKDPSNDIIAEIVSVNGTNYLKFPDSLRFSEIKNEANYIAYQKAIRKPRYLKEKVRLKPQDVANLDLQIPIYLSQYGKYYAIMQAQVKEDDITDLELLELKEI